MSPSWSLGSRRLCCLWPGLATLWRQGAWSGLAIAIAFAFALNLLLVSTFLWIEWIPAWARTIGWGMLLLFWANSAVGAWMWQRDQVATVADLGSDSQFVEARDFYLQGRWFDAESRLTRMLEKNERDVEAGLLFVSVLRRTQRARQAEIALSRLERFDEATPWRFEIAREREAIARSQAVAATEADADSMAPDSMDETGCCPEDGSADEASAAALAEAEILQH